MWYLLAKIGFLTVAQCSTYLTSLLTFFYNLAYLGINPSSATYELYELVSRYLSETQSSHL